ncbi:hypothetical protein T4D_6399 [Trichinella pseudospiralis]|uniref:Integrase catalytic domain-containing protein n=1 Tax=Trichinella pseudospiralis TaxID=6337 RepID=A0A0V1FAX9_TRIPS|nr:hypothetical protein T4D_6399 [Trichinella pseudospiralis]
MQSTKTIKVRPSVGWCSTVLRNGREKDCQGRRCPGATGILCSSPRNGPRRFWVVRGRQAVKKCIRACIICRKHDAPLFCPLVSHLPSERVAPSFPFNRVGLDFAGPFYVKDEQRPAQKAYICLFTCMVTRAVHLELVLDMTTISFLAALRRFIARRERPNVIHADNFPSFKQSDSFLRDLLHGKSADKIQEELTMRQIEWKYSTDRAPSCSGYCEQLVRSMKTALRKAQINDRPFTLLSENRHDCAPLTPAHFLNGRELASLLIPAASALAFARLQLPSSFCRIVSERIPRTNASRKRTSSY